MDFLFDFIDEFAGFDFLFKYLIIISNFLIIITLALIEKNIHWFQVLIILKKMCCL